jgi:glycogen debranching enzyme
MHRDGALQLDGHWTVIVPAQTGIATPARQHAVYQRVARDFVNDWGLMHTRGVDERVWTLPTGLLALTAFAHADVANGVRWLKTIGETTRHGTLGLMKELIPQGICFVQLWSTGLFAQGVVAGLFGIVPDAHAGHITITPRIPVDWPEMALTSVWMGRFLIDITITHHDITVRHTSMGEVLTVTIVHAQVNPTVVAIQPDSAHTWTW